MRNRLKEVLINPTWEQVIEREPLIAFSFYRSGRTNVLLDIADEIVERRDQGFLSPARDSGLPSVDGVRLDHADRLMWLWTLAALERCAWVS